MSSHLLVFTLLREEKRILRKRIRKYPKIALKGLHRRKKVLLRNLNRTCIKEKEKLRAYYGIRLER